MGIFSFEGDCRYFIEVQILGRTFAALINTGTIESFVGDSIRSLASQQGVARLSMPTHIILPNGLPATSTSEARRLTFELEGLEYTHTFPVVPDLMYDLVLGMNVLREIGLAVELPSAARPPSERSGSPPLVQPEPDSTQQQPVEEAIDPFAGVLSQINISDRTRRARFRIMGPAGLVKISVKPGRRVIAYHNGVRKVLR